MKVDKRDYTPQRWEQLKNNLKDSVCQHNISSKTYMPLKCSVNCQWLYECDECEEPFCFLDFKGVIDRKKVYLCHDSLDELCGDCHIGCDCYERNEPDKRQTCSECGFKTDSAMIMRIHSCKKT